MIGSDVMLPEPEIKIGPHNDAGTKAKKDQDLPEDEEIYIEVKGLASLKGGISFINVAKCHIVFLLLDTNCNKRNCD